MFWYLNLCIVIVASSTTVYYCISPWKLLFILLAASPLAKIYRKNVPTL